MPPREAAAPMPRTAWLVRAGRHGEDEDQSLESGLILIGFKSVPSLEGAKDSADVLAAVKAAAPDDKAARQRNFANQLTAFALRMETGDLVAMPLKTAPSQVAFGRVNGPYEYKKIENVHRHARPIEWLRPDVPRAAIAQDLLYSLGAFMTVCRIQRNDAEKRLAAVVATGKDPGLREAAEASSATLEPSDTSSGLLDVVQAAEDQIIARIQTKFREHALSRLVEAILRAEGYNTLASPPGADGGVDILAGRGALGLEHQRLCVQVKSSTSPADVKIFRELKGTMDSFKAEVGLLVSWGGFTKPLQQEARQSYFQVRLWDSGELLKAIYRTYDQLPEEIQAELPLKKVWALILDELE